MTMCSISPRVNKLDRDIYIYEWYRITRLLNNKYILAFYIIPIPYYFSHRKCVESMRLYDLEEHRNIPMLSIK